MRPPTPPWPISMNISSSRVRPALSFHLHALEPRHLLTSVPGSIDTTFGEHGVVTFAPTRPVDIQTIAIAALPKGKTLLLGQALADGTTIGDFELARINADGSPDAAFGEGGVRVVRNSLNMRSAAPDALYDFITPKALAVDQRGRIYVAGYQNIARLNSDGSPDRSFGSSGVFSSPISINALELAPDGDILVGGIELTGGFVTPNHRFGIARIHANGKLDESFGYRGVATVDFGGRAHVRNSTVHALALDADGRILAAGGDDGVLELARFNPNGSLDKTFGYAGNFALVGDVRSIPTSTAAAQTSAPYFAALAVRAADGEIFAAGGAPREVDHPEFGGPFVLAAITSKGQLDRRFVRDGVIQSGYGVVAGNYPRQVQIDEIALLADGKLVVAGTLAGGRFDAQPQGVIVARFDGKGVSDTSFGAALPLAPSVDSSLGVHF